MLKRFMAKYCLDLRLRKKSTQNDQMHFAATGKGGVHIEPSQQVLDPTQGVGPNKMLIHKKAALLRVLPLLTYRLISRSKIYFNMRQPVIFYQTQAGLVKYYYKSL